ncbi:hypothetical protein JIG36_00175 [Actinoplanes sp. LDG1-06]|uniref:DNA mismatch repair proteins mutS family domain-containing protein n=1 Tax=Paractinoplanes ovalisporus TaxID=2810368 RepID=A0ABS2A2P8_9ACTN|nr:hypothetical protein [Actinoplanes ovalisporus]MBM2613970.1 hypothetical protein [Actinoplanes ovalisporus]
MDHVGDDGLLALPATGPEPGYFPDLQLDQLVGAVVGERDAYNLKPAFHARLEDVAAVERRQAVFAALEDETLRSAVRAFCDGLARSEQLFQAAKQVRHPAMAQRWRLNAVAAYVRVVESMEAAGLPEWQTWLRHYRASASFDAMAKGARALLAELGELRYTLSISGDAITVSPFDGQEDLVAGTLAMFERFHAGEVPPHDFDLRPGAEMNQLQGAVLDLVVQLFPEVFDRVARFLDEHSTFRAPMVDVVEREFRFALSWLDFIAPVRQAGLPFCVPAMSEAARFDVVDTFDVLLARTLVAAGQSPVTNSVALRGEERMLVVTGPNQGGKTTFARTAGQLYHLAALGLPVPGRAAALHPPDAILTHFDRGDRAGEQQSRLEEEVTRMTGLLARATPRSVVILNEMFSSTTFVDARTMSVDVLREVLAADAVGVCVTFIDELSTLDPRIVSLVTGIETFTVTRGPADGDARSLALAARYGLTHDQLRARIEAHA